MAVYLLCVYARYSIARLLITCYNDDEESFNSFLPRTFYLKMVVVHIACSYYPPPSYMYHGY